MCPLIFTASMGEADKLSFELCACWPPSVWLVCGSGSDYFFLRLHLLEGWCRGQHYASPVWNRNRGGDRDGGGDDGVDEDVDLQTIRVH